MGACCTCQRGEKFEGFIVEEDEEKRREIEEDDVIANGDFGARVRLQGSSKLVSMFTQQGRKGINQDAMTVWEDFAGEKDMFFCGVFDGHGPSGHKVARHVRDNLPSKLSSSFKQSQICGSNGSNAVDDRGNDYVDSKNGIDDNFASWEATLIKSFKEMDEDLGSESTIESYCSGTTAVAILKQVLKELLQNNKRGVWDGLFGRLRLGHHLIIANLGDSRAVLCTRGNKDQLVSVQLTVDLKPNLPSEAERIRSCKGRVLALDEEPSVFRVWMPDQDCPGLAMARAFGDFCLKDFGLISIPEVSYRKLTDGDEFVVLATDGVWDVLTNNEVIAIVASARKRSMAARLLVDRAVRAWRCKYPSSRVDDCAVICLFLKRQRPLLTKSMSEVTHLSLNYSELGVHHYPTNLATEDGLETVLNCDINEDSKDRTGLDDGSVRAVDSSVTLPRLGGGLNRRRPANDFEYVEK